MMVELDNGMRFITNFRYNLKDGLSVNDKDQLKQISSGTDEFFFDGIMGGATFLNYLQF